MRYSFPVSNVVCNGSHFTADSSDGPIEGTGELQLNEAMDGGTITGSIGRGPINCLEKLILIHVFGNDGVCIVIEP